MLPSVVVQNQVIIALLMEPVLKFLWDVWQGVHIILDRPFLADEQLKFDFPALHQNADFGKITLRRFFYEGRVHGTGNQP